MFEQLACFTHSLACSHLLAVLFWDGALPARQPVEVAEEADPGVLLGFLGLKAGEEGLTLLQGDGLDAELSCEGRFREAHQVEVLPLGVGARVLQHERVPVVVEES